MTLTALVLPDKAKPSMRGRTNFARDPRTKPEVVYVFCKGGDVKVALGAGAAMAGGEELMEKVSPARGTCKSAEGGISDERGYDSHRLRILCRASI